MGHFPGTYATLFLVFDRRTGIGFLVFGGGIEVFSYGIEGITLLYIVLGIAGREQRYGTQDRNSEKAAGGQACMEVCVLHFAFLHLAAQKLTYIKNNVAMGRIIVFCLWFFPW